MTIFDKYEHLDILTAEDTFVKVYLVVDKVRDGVFTVMHNTLTAIVTCQQCSHQSSTGRPLNPCVHEVVVRERIEFRKLTR